MLGKTIAERRGGEVSNRGAGKGGGGGRGREEVSEGMERQMKKLREGVRKGRE